MVVDGVLYFSNIVDSMFIGSSRAGRPAEHPAWRVTAMRTCLGPSRQRLVCVREDHTKGGRGGERHGRRGWRSRRRWINILRPEGYNFYSTPRLKDPDGANKPDLALLEPSQYALGRHRLWRAADLLGKWKAVGKPERTRSGAVPRQILHFPAGVVTLRRSPFRIGPQRLVEPLPGERRPRRSPLPDREAEFGEPQWVFGMQQATRSPRRRAESCVPTPRTACGTSAAWRQPATPAGVRMDLPYTEISDVRVGAGSQPDFLGGSGHRAVFLDQA